MRSVWIALAVIVAGSLLGAFLLWRKLDTNSPARPLVGPRGAQLIEEHPLGTRRIVTWRIGGHAEEPCLRPLRRDDLAGEATALRASRKTEDEWHPRRNRRFQSRRRRDIVIVDESANCGFYRALIVEPTGVRQVLSRRLCGSHGSVRIRRNGLVIRRGNRALAYWTIER